MAFMTWRAGYGVGVDTIDQEHRELVAQVNAIHATLHSITSEDVKGEALRRFAACAKVHFQHEEETFVGTRYKRAALHARKHRHLMLILVSFQSTGRFMGLPEQLEFLRCWLIDHILVEDKPLGEYLNGVRHAARLRHPARYAQTN